MIFEKLPEVTRNLRAKQGWMSVFGQLYLTLIESSIKENVIIVHLGDRHMDRPAFFWKMLF